MKYSKKMWLKFCKMVQEITKYTDIVKEIIHKTKIFLSHTRTWVYFSITCTTHVSHSLTSYVIAKYKQCDVWYRSITKHICTGPTVAFNGTSWMEDVRRKGGLLATYVINSNYLTFLGIMPTLQTTWLSSIASTRKLKPLLAIVPVKKDMLCVWKVPISLI